MRGAGLILVTARIEAQPVGRRELAQALLDWMVRARHDGDALAAHVYEDLEQGNVFCLVSRWATRAAFETHVHKAPFGSLLGAVELLGRLSEVAVTEGEAADAPLETLRRLRHAKRVAGSDCL